jgi:hypothetical protein
MKYPVYNIIFITCFIFITGFICIILFLKKSILTEGFTWSRQTFHDFLKLQNTINPNTQFNMQMIQEQASEEEAIELLKKGSWPWTQETEYEYLNKVSHNKILNVNPVASMQKEKTIYNERAIQQLLAWNTKEGQFLLNGSLVDNGTIRCTTNDHGNTFLQKKVETGYNDWNGYTNYDITNIKNENIPQEVTGFHFINRPCNPCVALDNDYSCPFQISTKKEGSKISNIWKKLWNI